MVVVIVRDENDIDGRQVFERESGREEALWTEPLCRRGTFIPHRIDEDADAIDFDQAGSMTEPGDAQAGGGSCFVDARVGLKRAEGMTRRARRCIEEDARAHLEHDRNAADLCRYGIQVAFALALGSGQGHVDEPIWGQVWGTSIRW